MSAARLWPAAACVLAAAAVFFAFDPATTAWLPSCPFHALTGWWCPGCGTTRAAHALLHGHPIVALRENALVAGTSLYVAARWIANRRAPLLPRDPRLVLVALLLFAVARNVPVPPFTSLAP